MQWRKRLLKYKNKKLFYYKKLRLTDNYQHESEEEEETSKIPDKKQPPKKQEKAIRENLMNGLIEKKQVSTTNYLKSILIFKDQVISWKRYILQMIKRKTMA